MADPSDLSPREARERFLAKRQTDASDRTLRSYRARLGQFVEWCEEQQIERVGDLTPWHIDEYDMAKRQADLAPTTIRGHLATLRVLLKYLARVGAVDENLPDSVDVPTLSAHEESSDQRLAAEDAMELLRYFRNSPRWYGRPEHAFLEIAWHTGARMGGIRGLDLEDYDPDGVVAFRHRPSTDTPLKNKEDGERLVGIAPAVCDALDTYIARERFDKRDDHGRQPLFSCRQGRPSFSTLRGWSYLGTQPCIHSTCPHNRERQHCKYVDRTHASKCPSSRSPHPIRTGSITWQLNRLNDVEVVAKRVNATPAVIRRFYDKASEVEEFENRRRTVTAALDIDEEDENESISRKQ